MPRIISYRCEDGISGYRAGDVLHDTTTDDWCLAVADGRGVAMEHLIARQATGATCLGDWRLTPLDVGFDLRAVGLAAAAPADDDRCQSVGVDIDGEQYEFTGPRAQLIAVARAAGYTITG